MLPSTLPPNHLRSLLPNVNSPWMISSAVFKRLTSDPQGVYRLCEVVQSDPEWQFILQYFSAQKPAGKSIAKAFCVHNGAQHIQFETHLSTTEAQTKNPHFTPKWKTDAPHPLREKVLNRWSDLTQPYSPCTLPNERKDPITNAKIIPLWHGTKESICQSICETGFTTFGKHALLQGKKKDNQNTDLGYFGSGIYFTTSANYAATIYSDGNLLLAWVSMREPYPVIADKPYPDKPSDMQELEGLGAYKNFNAHYIPVISIQPDNPSCGIYYPCTETQEPALDEIVVFNPSQALARFWIQLQPDLLMSPTLTTCNHLLEHLLQLLDKEVVQQNQELAQLLENKSELLLACNLNDPLTPPDLEFYNCAIKLLDQAGKVRDFIHKQLVQKQGGVVSPTYSPTPVVVAPKDVPIVAAPKPSPIVQAVAIAPIALPKSPAIPACAFGKAKWALHFGDVGEEPSLPADIHQILQGPCPIWKGKKVEETHVLVLIPASVDGVPLTLKSLGKLVQKPKSGPVTQYKYFNLGQYRDIPENHSYWMLMSRDVLEGSRNKDWKTQFQQVALEDPISAGCNACANHGYSVHGT